ncbi:MAG: recombinase family protein [Cellulosilyticaceae bacterium]
MNIAIYSRKSKFTGKGDSIENQIEMCKMYVEQHFGTACQIFVYEDEGFSGGNIDRPQFKLLLHDAKQKKFDTLVCYRLDRVSRNIGDFSNLIELLEAYQIAFVSVRESFDTTTPMGRAMMYISSVFAQLERETIAERISDNMLQLAKTGRWLGGITPTGFNSEETIVHEKGKDRKIFKLVANTAEIEIIKLIYTKFLELNSLTQLETYLLNQGITTKNNKAYSRFALRNILNNPVYAQADEIVYNYLMVNNYTVYATEQDFDGNNGVMAYNKTIQKKHTANKLREPSQWIVSVGAHVGIISGSDWTKVQQLIDLNKSKTFRKVKNTDSLLSGILRCKSCGSFMRPKVGRTDSNGNKIFYYSCELKEKSRMQQCNMKNVKGNDADYLVVEKLKALAENKSTFKEKMGINNLLINSTHENITRELELLNDKLKSNQHAINNLVSTLSQAQNTSASKYIIEQINQIDEQNAKLKESLYELKTKAQAATHESDTLNIFDDMLTRFANTADNLTILDRRESIRALVDEITWDGNEINIVVFGANAEKK